jgi:hypothetical protein
MSIKHLKDALEGTSTIKPSNGKPIRTFTTGKLTCALLVERNGSFVALSEGDKEPAQTWPIKIVAKSDKVLGTGTPLKILSVNFNSVVADIAETE